MEILKAGPLAKRVALIGHSPSSRLDADFSDPELAIWTMNDAHGFLGDRRVDAWFEIHIESLWRDPARRLGGYIEKLKAFNGPVYMDQHYKDIPNSVAYPLDEYFKKYGRGVFGSSFAYLIAHAVELGFTEIQMYGCDLASEDEYKKQRESTAFWIGYCRGRGITFKLPDQTPILCAQPYGRGRMVIPGLTEETINTRIQALRADHSKFAAGAMKAEGHIEEAVYWRAALAQLVEQ